MMRQGTEGEDEDDEQDDVGGQLCARGGLWWWERGLDGRDGRIDESQTTDTPSTGAVSVTEASAGTTSVGETTQAGTLTDGTSTTGTGGTGSTTDDPPPQKQCSADFHAVVDEQGNLLEACAPDQGCADGACIAACDAAAASKANFGCGFLVPTPPAYPPALPPCFAVFLANTVRPNPPQRPRTSRSAAIPGKRALWRGWARPTRAQRAPVRPGFWQRFGNARFARFAPGGA